MNATRFQLVAIIALPVFMFAITFAACDDDDDDNDNDDDDTAGDDDDDDNDDDDNDNNDDDDDDDNDDDDDPCVVWHHELPGGIAESVSLSDTTNEAWVAVQLNDESLLHFALDGGGAPDFSVDLMTFETERSLVAAAGSVSLGVAVIQSTGHDVFATAFNSTNGETALWTYDFDEGFTLLSGALDVAADGSVVVAGARDPVAETTLLVVLDGATGVELRRLEQAANISTVELSDDGARAVFTEGATASVVDITNLSMLFSFAVSGSGGRHGISRDGNAVAAGGFDAAAYVETAKGWELAWSEAEATQWYGNGLALSGDGETLFAVSRNYSNNLDLTYRVIDLVSGAELARATTNGTGSFQDSPWRARVSADGAVLAIASWGLENNAHPEVQIFDRAATVIGGVDMPGSPFDLDLSADGRYLLVGGKAVHANDMGSGGDVFLCDIEAFPTRNR